LALTDEQPSMDDTAAIGGAADIGGLRRGQDGLNWTLSGQWQQYFAAVQHAAVQHGTQSSDHVLDYRSSFEAN
jgi:hypothetical protein